ncbi:hypothetical protein AB3S75_034861 [Citrus x aurantiifolia]
MKLSLKLPDDSQNTQNPPILKAKIPITIFNQPFISSLTTTTTTTKTVAAGSQHLSFSLGTNFPSGPSFKLSYTPLSTTITSTAPFSFSLKSGLGLFGSPQDSPLIFSAHFPLSYTNPTNFTPTFLLHFKPQFGNFSLHKTTSSSNPNPANSGPHFNSGSHLQSGSPSNTEFANRSISDESSGWQDLKLEPRNGNGSFFNGVDSICSDGIGFFRDRTSLLKDDDKKGGFLGGIAVKARTVLPVTKRVMMNLRWGLNLPADSEVKMPYLTVNKIGIERVEKVEEVKREKNIESDVGDLELLKGMCFWMRRDLDLLEKENKDMKHCLEKMAMGVSPGNFHGISDSIGKKVFPYSSESFGEAKSYGGASDTTGNKLYPASSESFGEFERRRNKKNGEGNGHAEYKKSVNQASDLESQLQNAIKAASS